MCKKNCEVAFVKYFFKIIAFSNLIGSPLLGNASDFMKL